MNSTGLAEAVENVRNASRALRAYMDFQNEVARIAIDMAGRKDPTALVLLRALHDLEARTGELYVEEIG